MGRPKRARPPRLAGDTSASQGGAAGVLLIIGGILVATIMAALSFKLDRDLAEKSRTAGDETLQELGAALDVVSVFGERDPDDRIRALQVTIRAARGVETSLLALVVQLEDRGGRGALLGGLLGNDTFGVEIVRDANGSATNQSVPLFDAGDLARLVIDLHPLDLTLAPGDTLTLRLRPDNGLDTTLALRAPVTGDRSRFVALE